MAERLVFVHVRFCRP